MRKFDEYEIEKYIEYVDENLIEISEVEGQCHICGKYLTEVELPEGPERKVVCLNNLEDFIENYKMLEEDELIRK
ncbi:hypothetical protein AST07_07480 [Staphylococcus saprophyticus]|uniref:hypothetical protein n=1 Tax=Staphylococcus saprophyticus TaxID=29385 RepID=UPI0008532FC3|nr:hypothetical protein [Staphylococcus saprophyticus]MEB5700416.1 hypothetical protein [Staphylococcus saprophyticus]OEK92981.1 hypothetical protein AST07_07480 [Staphylococcus saprophyticus]SUM89516.1 Uncharacterised protein [Staphylococcus saprophyticus]